MNGLVSIIVPVYNVEKYLNQCLGTLINQTYKNIEIIIVNDGSTDDSLQICNEYSAKDSRIKLVSKKNAGLGYARNTGLEHVTGEYLIFVDSDDYIELDMVEKLYSKVTDTKSDVCYCSLKRHYNDDNIVNISSIYEESIFENEQIIDNILLRMLGNKPQFNDGSYFYMSVWHAIYSIDIIKKYNIQFKSEREYLSEDIFFHIDYLTKARKIVCIPDCLYVYRVNPNSLSLKKDKNRFIRILDFHSKLKEELSKHFPLEIYHQIELGWFLSLVIGIIFSISKNDTKLFVKIKEIREICKNYNVKNAINEYSYHLELKKKRKLFIQLMKRKCALLMYLAIKIKNHERKR